MTSHTSDPADVALPKDSSSDDVIRIPRWAVAAGVAFLVIMGIVWTSHRRTMREGDAAALNNLVNEIDQTGMKARRALEQERRKRRAERSPVGVAGTLYVNTLPADLPESHAIWLIETSEVMRAPQSVTIPKQFAKHLYDWTLRQNPSLFAAVRDGFVEFDPPLESIYTDGRNSLPNFAAPSEMINVKLTSRGSMIGLNDGGNSYTASFGSRHVTTVIGASSTGDRANVQFRWAFAVDEGSSLIFDSETRNNFVRTGSASMVKEGSWRVESVRVR
jgi:hypothetical protein